ncbi:hypothetical protein M404DRAFT_30868 [Pisolithus tinctorius Marx 270]|uniref:Reverse transcriptase domain-containing protein n=1 Tax=Pisolithus tinctorius Marx 270 TaxID=870435 RepID=A0A0C3NV33_PISTI|nr:hypothetical protein M404DRAFT_30868 [Pisolithus tinctorius Marx 270]
MAPPDPEPLAPRPTTLGSNEHLTPQLEKPVALGLTCPPIAFVNAAAYVQACKLEGSSQFSLQLHPSALTSLQSSKVEDTPNLSGIPLEYHEYANMFSKSKATTLAPHWEHDLKIKLEGDSSPPLSPIYSLSPVELEALQAFLDEHLATGVPVLFVKKKDGSLQLCVDFWGLNKITKKDQYPLPLITNLLDSPSWAKVYTKIDLRHVYHLVWITDGDEWKTTFCTWYGSFEWLVMPFDVCIVVYLDDILIYSNDKNSHQQHVEEHGLYAKPEKCEFHSESVEYLGYCLLPAGLTMSGKKIKAICNWPKPWKVKDIQSFLGFANFY